MDRNGRIAAAGHVHEDLLAELMAHPYFRRRPPRSAGREDFGDEFTDRLYDRARRRGLSPADVVATATAFTARSIAGAYRRFGPKRIDEVLLCGGGAANATLVEMLRGLPGVGAVRTTDDLGIGADAKEAVSFAVLAARTIRGAAGNVPGATGADRPVVLGKIVPARGANLLS
jgi:anhydro-N-acetylmuramic acid kinase